MARPTDYTMELSERICEELAAGFSLVELCKAEDMPSDRTVYRWLAKDEEFRQRYARARELQTECMSDEMLAIADDTADDFIDIETGEGATVKRANTEHIQRSKLRIDTRKWIMSKLRPKKYGDKIQHSGSVDLNSATDSELDNQIKALQQQVGDIANPSNTEK